jgi:hypothetical protein
MKSLFSILTIVVLAAAVAAQSTTQVSRKCPGVNPSPERSKIEVEKDGDINLAVCSGKSVTLSGTVYPDAVKLVDRTYTSIYPGTNYFSAGTNNRITIPAANNLVASEISLPVTVSGTNKSYIGQRTALDVQGTMSNPTIVGTMTSLFSNSTFPAGTGTITGTSSSVDVGGPFLEAYGGRFSALAGSGGADGLGTIIGLQGVVGPAHNGNTGTSVAGDFWTATSSSSPVTVTLGVGIRSRARFNPGVTFTDYRGIQISNWLNQGGAIQNSIGLYIDNSIDLPAFGTVSKYAIKSDSTSNSAFAGHIVFPNGKGVILTSPNGTTYLLTVDDSGTLTTTCTGSCP